jgi:hypothetical protein
LFLYQNVWAQTPPAPTTSLPTITSNTATQDSAGGAGASPQIVVQQGVVTSSTDPLPGHQAHQSATILRLRNDNAVYSGTLTFTSTKPVEVQVLHRNMTTTTTTATEGTNATAPGIPEEYGALSILQLAGNNGAVSISNIVPQFPEDATTFAASIPFSGNAVALHNLEGEPFAATYTVTAAVVGAADRADDIGPAPPAPEEEEEEEEG